jgi:FkbM family methyltransferase
LPSISQFLKTQLLTRLPDAWLVALKRRHYERILRAFDEDQEPDLRIVRHLVRPGATAIDLGANIGVYTKVLSALAGPDGKVISVEPVPPTFRILARNCSRLGMTNVQLVNAAVSDERRELTMEVPDYESGGENYYQAQVLAADASLDGVPRYRRFHVRARTLDDIASDVESIAFVKCDVEGHELRCLAGAQAVLAKHHPAWLIEVSGDPDAADTAAAKVFAVLEGHRYNAWFFDGLRLKPRRRGDQHINYFFLADSHVAEVRNANPELLS